MPNKAYTLTIFVQDEAKDLMSSDKLLKAVSILRENGFDCASTTETKWTRGAYQLVSDLALSKLNEIYEAKLSNFVDISWLKSLKKLADDSGRLR